LGGGFLVQEGRADQKEQEQESMQHARKKKTFFLKPAHD